MRVFCNNRFDFVTSYFKTSSLKINSTPEYDLTGWSDGNDYYIEGGEKQIGIGLKIKINDFVGIVSEYNDFNSFNSYDFLNILDDDFPDMFSKHLGLYYIIDMKNKNQLVDRVNLRLGFYSKKYTLRLSPKSHLKKHPKNAISKQRKYISSFSSLPFSFFGIFLFFFSPLFFSF